MKTVSLCAANPALGFSYNDAVIVIDTINDLIGPKFGEWVEVEAVPVATGAEKLVDPAKIQRVGWTILFGCGFWLGVIALLIRSIR